MSVVGTIILVMLFLILKLITQAAAKPSSLPVMTETELMKRIQALETNHQEIHDEILSLNQALLNQTPYVPSWEQVDILHSSVERLERDVVVIEEEIKTAQEYHREMVNRPDAGLAAEMEAKIRELKQWRDQLSRKNSDLKNQKQNLQSRNDDLKKQQTDLNLQLEKEVVQRVYAVPNKMTDKIPYLLIYGQGTIRVLSQADPDGQSFRSRQAFFTWVANRNQKTEYFVLYIRPSRFDEYASILDQLKQLGFDIGLQVIGENTEISLQ